MSKNIKDSKTNINTSIKDMSSLSMSYTKTHKLITALYMVTDIMDKEEPLRLRLRTLGIEILSDTSTMSKTIIDIKKIDQIMSFLNIASTLNFISEMNYNILKKEFLELKESIKEYVDVNPSWLGEFLLHSNLPDHVQSIGHYLKKNPPKGHYGFYKGHTNIGVQKGSTLMKALSDKTLALGLSSRAREFNVLKKQRRDSIIDIIKDNKDSATIKDIKEKINVTTSGTLPFSEKTLQRELSSMAREGVLNKMGEKRWSRYSVKIN